MKIVHEKRSLLVPTDPLLLLLCPDAPAYSYVEVPCLAIEFEPDEALLHEGDTLTVTFTQKL